VDLAKYILVLCSLILHSTGRSVEGTGIAKRRGMERQQNCNIEREREREESIKQNTSLLEEAEVGLLH
jgi:hypothetical protein